MRTWRIADLAVVGLGLAICVSAQGKVRQADFDGDGVADLAIGVLGEDVGGAEAAGGVAVIYGKHNHGLDATGDQFWTMDSPGVNGEAETNGLFGNALAVGDFDHDGYSDLVIGAPGETMGGFAQAGAVHVLYGSASGLRATGDQVITRESGGIDGNAVALELFGSVLETGDFDNNGKDDLAIGCPRFTYSGHGEAGDLIVVFGKSGGLNVNFSTSFDIRVAGLTPANNDHFGAALVSGDFDHNGQDDLAIGVPGCNSVPMGGPAHPGAVVVLYNDGALGLVGGSHQILQQGYDGLDANAPGADDEFGSVLAAGDFDGNGKDDLAITSLREDVNGKSDAGGVHVVYGSSSGLKTSHDQFWTQDSNGILDAAGDDELWGTSLTAGDFDGDGKDDLAVGVNYEDVSGHEDAGAVNVIYGSSSGLNKAGNQLWHQDREGIRDHCEDADYWGEFITCGDYNGDGRDDLAVGARFEKLNGLNSPGAVNVIYGHAGGLNKAGNQFWHQDSPGINDSAQTNDQFGGALR